MNRFSPILAPLGLSQNLVSMRFWLQNLQFSAFNLVANQTNDAVRIEDGKRDIVAADVRRNRVFPADGGGRIGLQKAVQDWRMHVRSHRIVYWQAITQFVASARKVQFGVEAVEAPPTPKVR